MDGYAELTEEWFERPVDFFGVAMEDFDWVSVSIVYCADGVDNGFFEIRGVFRSSAGDGYVSAEFVDHHDFLGMASEYWVFDFLWVEGDDCSGVRGRRGEGGGVVF